MSDPWLRVFFALPPAAFRVSFPSVVVALLCGVISVGATRVRMLASEPTERSAVVVALDGTESNLTLSVVDQQGRLHDAAGATPWTLDRLQRIELRRIGHEQSQRSVVELGLKAAGRLLGSKVTLADERFELERGTEASVGLSLEAVASVQFVERLRASKVARLPMALADQDQFVVVLEGRVETIAGVLSEVNAERLTFEHEGRGRSLALNQVVAIVLASSPAQTPAEAKVPRSVRSLLSLADGSEIATEDWTLRDGRITAKLLGGGLFSGPWNEVECVEINSWRQTLLSSLKPLTFVERPVVAAPRGWRVDRSLDGNTLRIGGREFTRGLALAGGATAEFEVATEASSFEAWIGIDDETEGRGDCVATLSIDGRPVYSQRLRGGEAARAVRVDLRGAKRLRLAVESGAGLDLSDHVDWGDARVLREQREDR